MDNINDINIKELPEFNGHELVSFLNDKKSGLRGFISIHNTNLGPAIGGTRMVAYDSDVDALRDVLRLSAGMTYKSALAGVKLGGGKGVIILDKSKNEDERREILKAYGKRVSLFKGNFSTGTDVGITDEDAEVMASASEFIVGRQTDDSDRLNTSKMAALGVFYTIQSCVEEVLGVDSLKGMKIAVKGTGKVGDELIRLLLEEGAEIVATDIDEVRISQLKEKYPKITLTDCETIHTLPVDVYAPCAMGGEFNHKTVKEVRAKVIAGAANNQLESLAIGDEIHKMGILYAPDYVANAGGLINAADELEEGGYNKERVLARVLGIKKTIGEIISNSLKEDKPTYLTSNEMAEKIIYNK